MNEEYHFQKLLDIKAMMPKDQHEFSTGGVIVDSTNPHRKDSKKDYCMRLKIIDPNNLALACTVFLYGKSIQDFPKKIKAGDILLLHKFGFEVWNGNLQAKKHFKVAGAFSRFFSGDPSAESYASIDNQVGLDDSQGKILTLVNNLRKASKTSFTKNTVPLVNKSSKTSSDFDLILKVNGASQIDGGAYKIHMTNTVNEFDINYCEEVTPGIYKIRSIADFSWKAKKCELLGNDYTCFMEIPSWMKSSEAKEWEKIIPGKASQDNKAERDRVQSKIIGEKKVDRKRNILLRDLISRDNHKEDVRVTCEFVEVFTSYERALKKYDGKNNTEKFYESQEGEYIYNIHFVITDKSLDGELFNVYIYSHDGKGNEFLPGLDPKKIFGKNILANKEKYDNLMNRLLEESDCSDAPIDLVLSPMHNGKDTIYRIIDTELLI